ncbi:Xiap protein [Apostichopus japonicus]|uniref:Xiap protein n=1 Tax=Stichopus japonicus TaxID=307972 RepID=A0A2G8LN70_STIJA|nr:Xiap protein [Apostichopus japonicus]
MEDDEFNRLFNDGAMKSVSKRQLTFVEREWKNIIATKEMSTVGFCFTGEGDTVVCFACKGVLSSWKAGSVPLAKHLKAFPDCQFARDLANKCKRGSNLQFDNATAATANTAYDDSDFEDIIRLVEKSFYRSECNRLLSFAKSSTYFPEKPQEIARAGFYCKEDSLDTVKCFACLVEVKTWNRSDNSRLSTRKYHQIVLSKDESRAETKTPIKAKRDDPMHATAKHKEYVRENQRMESFSTWPECHFIKPIALAKAGFFKSGEKDEVTCFYCGVGLGYWEPGDDPLEEHGKGNSSCKWLKLLKSKNKVKEAKRKSDITKSSFEQKGGDTVKDPGQQK